MSEVIRIFVEKKDGFNVLAKQTLWDIRHNLGMKSVEDLRYIVRYDLEGLTKEEYEKTGVYECSIPALTVVDNNNETRRKPLFCQSLMPM